MEEKGKESKWIRVNTSVMFWQNILASEVFFSFGFMNGERKKCL